MLVVFVYADYLRGRQAAQGEDEAGVLRNFTM
jgi:hypothetical protein